MEKEKKEVGKFIPLQIASSSFGAPPLPPLICLHALKFQSPFSIIFSLRKVILIILLSSGSLLMTFKLVFPLKNILLFTLPLYQCFILLYSFFFFFSKLLENVLFQVNRLHFWQSRANPPQPTSSTDCK